MRMLPPPPPPLTRRRKNSAEQAHMKLKRMLRLDADMVQEQYLLSKETAITDELISLGALTQNQLETVYRERRQEQEEQERKWGGVASKRGAMGDAVSTLLAPPG